MAGAACKVIINQLMAGLAGSIEKILIDPNVNMGLIPETHRKRLIQDLANIDIQSYDGTSSGVSLVGILVELESYGLISPDVWAVLRRPVGAGIKGQDKEGKEGKGSKDEWSDNGRDKERGELHDD